MIPSAVVHTACGFVAGSAGAIAAYPIDYVKSQLQTEAGRAKYTGGMEAALDIVQTGGPFALYRGVMVNIIGIAPEKTIKLSVNEAARLAIQAHFGYLPIVGEMVAGGFAGMTQVTVTNPLEVVKVRMQTSDMTVQEVIGSLRSFADYYQGAGACIARDVTFSAILFPLYAHAKVAFAAMLVSVLGGAAAGDGAILFWANMVAGSLAAAPAAILATPFDVVKTRQQQARREQVSPVLDTLIRQPNSVEVFQTIWQEEGPAVFFSGWLERCVRSVPQFGVTLAVFDILNTLAMEHGLLMSETLQQAT